MKRKVFRMTALVCACLMLACMGSLASMCTGTSATWYVDGGFAKGYVSGHSNCATGSTEYPEDYGVMGVRVGFSYYLLNSDNPDVSYGNQGTKTARNGSSSYISKTVYARGEHLGMTIDASAATGYHYVDSTYGYTEYLYPSSN